MEYPSDHRQYTGIKAGTYTVVVSDSKGCTTTATVLVNNIPGPTAAFTGPEQCVNSNIVFTNTSTGGSTYFWDFGDGNTSPSKTPNHSYTTPGTKTVKLVVTDATGICKDSTTQIITIDSLPT